MRAIICIVSLFRPGLCEQPETKRLKLSPEEEAFLRLIQYFEENDDSYLTLTDMHNKMSQLIPTPYTIKWLKSKLISHYGDSLVIANMDGLKDVLYLKESANKLLYQFYEEGRKTDIDDEKERIIKLAASLIKSDVADIVPTKISIFHLMIYKSRVCYHISQNHCSLC